MWLARLVAPYPADFIGRSRLRVSNEKAKRELGWKPELPTFREGIAAMAES
jgi:nucleoside-diphosphate-sugar epimerase